MANRAGCRRLDKGRKLVSALGSALEAASWDLNGASAVEFALAVPVLIVLLLGGTEVFRLSRTAERVVATANALGEMVSSSQTSPTASDLGFVSNAGMLIAPQVLIDAQTRSVSWGTILRSNYTSVVFKPAVPGCLVLCTYVANVAWSAGAQRRPCGQLQAAANGASYSPTTLPSSVFSSTSVIVVDVQYDYRPMFGTRFIGTKTITRSAYFVPRYMDPVTLGDMSANPSLATTCPGYS